MVPKVHRNERRILDAVCRSPRCERLAGPRDGGQGGDRRSLQVKARLHRAGFGFGRSFSDDPIFKAQFARITEGLRKAGLPEGEAQKD
jgi:hypothetical protein